MSGKRHKKVSPHNRGAKKKARRLEAERKRNVISTNMRRHRADVSITAMRLDSEGEVVIGVRYGLFGHPRNVMLRIDDEALVGCVEDRAELAKLVNNVGILVTSQLFGHNLAEGIEKLGETVALWAGIDLDKLRAEAAASEIPVPLAEPHVCDLCRDQPPGSTCPPITIEVPSVDDAHPRDEAPVL